jgi:NAD(P)H dehydrogenase (quinone)
MTIELIVAHPDKASFNHAIAAVCLKQLRANGHDVTFHDLHEERFDPALQAGEYARDAVLPAEVRRHCREIRHAEGIIVVHPNWWGQPPAILKGWVDRVLRPGVAYEFLPDDKGEGIPRGLLQARRALIFNTSNTDWEREKAVFGDPLDALWKKCILGLCGVEIIERRMFSIVVTSTEEERKTWLAEVGETVNRIFPALRSAPSF